MAGRINRTSGYGVVLHGNPKDIADDFAGKEHPKLKFNFTILFDFNAELAGIPDKGNEDPYKITFGLKQITRPNPNIVYEDVNYYNFMTKVATKVDFGVMTVTLYDDVNNRAHKIFKQYMEAVSPITKLDKGQHATLDDNGQSTSANLKALNNGSRNGLIKSIRVKHITDGLGGKSVNYDFLNPKIQNVVLDDLDMSQSEVNTITLTFVYDSFNITEESEGGIEFGLEGAAGFEEMDRVNAENVGLLGQILGGVGQIPNQLGGIVQDSIPGPLGGALANIVRATAGGVTGQILGDVVLGPVSNIPPALGGFQASNTGANINIPDINLNDKI